MTTIPVSLDAVDAAARTLLRAARFDEADELLGAHPDLAVLRVEVALARDWVRARVTPVEVVHAARAVARSADAAWALEHLAVRRDYAAQFFAPDPDGHDALVRRATTLRDTAPDDVRRGWAEFALGLIADNVLRQRNQAPAHYERALAVAEEHGDDMLLFETLRHLGDHAHDDGDAALARQRWERSTWHAARAGTVTGTLAQHLLLAVLAREDGDKAGARLLGTEVERWTDAIGATALRDRTTAFLAGADPTQEPPDRGFIQRE